MPQNQIVYNALNLLVALSALGVAIGVERRAQKRFQSQIDTQKHLTVEGVKPLVTILTSRWVNYKAVTLINNGTGVAIITEISFSKGDATANNLADLFKLSDDVKWDTWHTFSDPPFYLKAGSSRQFVQISSDNLMRQRLDETTALVILEGWENQADGIFISIKYQDIFGNQQPDYTKTITMLPIESRSAYRPK